MATSYPAGLPIYQVGPGGAEDFARRVKEMSNGRLQIHVYSAGELMPALQVFENTSAGNIDMHYSNSYYWAGKTFAAQYFTTVPFGMTYIGHTAWLTQGGGIDLWHEVYDPFNLIAFPTGSSGPQMGGWFKKPFNSVKDLQGINFRCAGLAGDIYNGIGVNTRLLGGGEIFAALNRGVIDGAEWVGPYLDEKLGLQNAAKYYYEVEWHEPATTTEVAINKDKWKSLPDDLQAIIKHAAYTCHVMAMMEAETKNEQALTDLVENHGVILKKEPVEVTKALYKVAREIYRKKAKSDPLIEKVNNSYWKFKKKHDRWEKASKGAYDSIVRDIAHEDDLIV